MPKCKDIENDGIEPCKDIPNQVKTIQVSSDLIDAFFKALDSMSNSGDDKDAKKSLEHIFKHAKII